MLVSVSVSVSFYKLERKEADAKVANLFGDYERAAGLYAAAARKYWEAGAYAAVLRTVVNACENLHAAGMDEEVVEGIVVVSKMLIGARRPLEAIELGDYYAHFERKDPSAFKGGSRYGEHLREICKQKKILVCSV